MPEDPVIAERVARVEVRELTPHQMGARVNAYAVDPNDPVRRIEYIAPYGEIPPYGHLMDLHFTVVNVPPQE
jgi:hypothetical protein